LVHLLLQREGEPLPDVPARVPNTAAPRAEGAGGGGGAARGGAAADSLASSYVQVGKKPLYYKKPVFLL